MRSIKKEVLKANRWIVEKDLVELTWGNVSYRQGDVIYIKPSGVDLDTATEEDISVLTIYGQKIDGKKPSVDTPTHLEIYKNFNNINCIVHTHSKYSTTFAQANRQIPCLGTTHADYFYGDIPCVPHPNRRQIETNYELETGVEICKYFKSSGIDYKRMPCSLVSGHGAFIWGPSIEQTLETAYVLELVAEMAYKSLTLIGASSMRIPKYVIDKHFFRKNGKEKYYGQ